MCLRILRWEDHSGLSRWALEEGDGRVRVTEGGVMMETEGQNQRFEAANTAFFEAGGGGHKPRNAHSLQERENRFSPSRTSGGRLALLTP